MTGLLKMIKNILLLPLNLIYVLLAIVILLLKALFKQYSNVENSTRTFLPNLIKGFKRNRARKKKKKQRIK